MTLPVLFAAQARFPAPEFENYTLPKMSLEELASDSVLWRVLILAVFLAAGSLCFYKWRSRKAMLAYSLAGLAVFGFLFASCPCPVGMFQNIAEGIAAGPSIQPGVLLQDRGAGRALAVQVVSQFFRADPVLLHGGEIGFAAGKGRELGSLAARRCAHVQDILARLRIQQDRRDHGGQVLQIEPSFRIGAQLAERRFGPGRCQKGVGEPGNLFEGNPGRRQFRFQFGRTAFEPVDAERGASGRTEPGQDPVRVRRISVADHPQERFRKSGGIHEKVSSRKVIRRD